MEEQVEVAETPTEEPTEAPVEELIAVRTEVPTKMQEELLHKTLAKEPSILPPVQNKARMEEHQVLLLCKRNSQATRKGHTAICETTS